MASRLVTIIVPVRNNQLTIVRCLEALARQDYQNFEIIVVDNDSTDNTKKNIEIFLRNENFRITVEKIIGRGAARQAGVGASRGDVIAMIDADCVPSSDWVSRITKPIIDGEEKIVMGAVVEGSKNYWSRLAHKEDENFIDRKLDGSEKYINHLDTANFAIDGNLMRQIKFDKSLVYFEDFDLFLRLSQNFRVRFLNDVSVVHYRMEGFGKEATTQFWRAYWLVRIYHKNKFNNAGVYSMFDSLAWWNWITFPFWFLTKMLLLPVHRLPFFVVTQLSWRAGILWGIIHI